MRTRLWTSLAACAALLGGTAQGTAAASERRLSATGEQLLGLSERMAAAGSTEQAKTILSALEQDPDPNIRNEARFRIARLLEAQGMNTGAAVLLRAVVDDAPTAVPARLELAQLLDRMGDRDGAWRQMRAVRASGLPASVARLIDRYSEALRAARPAGMSIEVALAPDSNINRATRSDTLGTVIGDFTIDQDAKAKSGTGLAISAQGYRRLGIPGTSAALLARVSGFGDLYRRSKFNDIAVDVAAGPELQLGSNRLNLEAGATMRWFGQKPYSRSARIGAAWMRPLGGRTQLDAGLSAALIDNRVNHLEDGRDFSARLSVEHALSPTMGVIGTLSGERMSARDPGYSTTGWRAGLSLWRDVGRLTLTAGGEFGRLSADERLSLFPDRRSDRYTRLSLAATFRQLQFGGFAPVARFSMERNRSSIAFYDYKRRRMEIGFARAF